MRLLVSVSKREEVRAALDGGADIVDVKNPARGALGAPDLATVRAVRDAVSSPRLMSAAIGDASELRSSIITRARAAASSGADFVKIGLHDAGRAAERILHALALAVAEIDPAVRVVGVGYADRLGETSLGLPERARSAGAHAVMLDTCEKNGTSLLDHLQEATIVRFIALGHDEGLLVGLAGSLTLAEIASLRGCGADVLGVRGAACRGGREGRISASRVRRLAQSIRSQPPPAGTTISHSRPAEATAK